MFLLPTNVLYTYNIVCIIYIQYCCYEQGDDETIIVTIIVTILSQ